MKKNIKNFLNISGEKIYKYRYLIGIIIILFCVLFQLNGSSIGSWNNFMNSGIEDEGHISGTPRSIRSDEWAVFTPLTFSQYFNNFKWFNNLIRADKTDIFMIYGLPTLNLMQIYRPFQIGYLLLGLSRGLSFYWCARLVFLFLISFEFGMILSKKNKTLSVIMATLIALSPLVQWWFAVNGIAEIIIFGELALISLYNYMNTDSLKKRAIYLFLAILSAGGYILVLYPAWQIPMFYVFLFLAIDIIVQNWKNCKINYKDVISIIFALIIFICSMVYIFNRSFDTIKTIMNTVYPSSRTELGGGAKEKFVDYLQNIFLTYKEDGLKANTSESALMFGLFPIGLIISFIAMIKNKKIDLTIAFLLIPYAIIGIYCVLGFPEILAKISLIGFSMSKRAVLAIGYIDILILIRGITILEKPIKFWISLLISAITSIILVYLVRRINGDYITNGMSMFLLVVCMVLFYFSFNFKAKFGKAFLLVSVIFVMYIAGFTVNPLRRGIGIVYDSPIINGIQSINNNENGTWLVEGIGFPIPNYVLMAGVPVINCTNVYPDLDRWKALDSENKYEDVYNRYAHIQMNLLHENDKCDDKFVLTLSDSFTVYVYPEELKKLNVKYIFAVRPLEEYDTENVKFEILQNINGYVIYKVNYTPF